MTPQKSPPSEKKGQNLYRPNVGIVVFNDQGEVWLGRRVKAVSGYSWQFPQGGIDPGEDPLDAARRELREETGITSVSLLARAEGWITYEFPPNAATAKAARGYKGQSQAWFAFRFDGKDSEIDLTVQTHQEFDAWRWARLNEAVDLIVPFKREAYVKVVAAFRDLVPTAGRR